MILDSVIISDWVEGLKSLPDESVNCCVTSPPYFGLRDYGVAGQLGLEETPEQYVQKLVEGFNEVKRVIKNDGTLWLNLGDSYAANRGSGNSSIGAKQATNSGANLGSLKVPAGFKEKDLMGIPWMVAFALRSNGWYLRQDIIWHKPNPMPESVTDRCTKSHEYIFLLSKSARYYYDADAIKEPSGNGKKDFYDVPLDRNKRSVWSIPTHPYSAAHFATFPEDLIVDCIKAGCPVGGLVLDPFMGAGTTAIVSRKLNRKFIGIELNPQYADIAAERLKYLPSNPLFEP